MFLRALAKIPVSRFRANSVLFYLYDESRTSKKWSTKAKKDDGKIEFANLDKSKMMQLDISPSEG